MDLFRVTRVLVVQVLIAEQAEVNLSVLLRRNSRFIGRCVRRFLSWFWRWLRSRFLGWFFRRFLGRFRRRLFRRLVGGLFSRFRRRFLGRSVSWLRRRLLSRFIGRRVCRLLRWLRRRLVGRLLGWFLRRLFRWLLGWFFRRLFRWLLGWFFRRLWRWLRSRFFSNLFELHVELKASEVIAHFGTLDPVFGVRNLFCFHGLTAAKAAYSHTLDCVTVNLFNSNSDPFFREEVACLSTSVIGGNVTN